MRPIDIENPMVLGGVYPEDVVAPVGRCKTCDAPIYGGDGGATFDDELFCSPSCLWEYLMDDGFLEEI